MLMSEYMHYNGSVLYKKPAESSLIFWRLAGRLVHIQALEGAWYGWDGGPTSGFPVTPPFDTPEECAQWLTMMEATQ